MLEEIMKDQRRALGKGLESLIPNRKKEEAKNYFLCALEDIVPNPSQPRKLFAKATLDELAASIEKKGVLQPIIVRPLGGGKYELIAGERRYRAAKMVGLEKIPAVINETDESGTLEIALIENIQRQDLNPIEEAVAYKELLSRHQHTQEELASQLGKDRSSIANSLRLLKLPDKVRDCLINNQISMGHARALLAIDSKELQVQVANDIIQNNLSVREVEVLTKKFKELNLENVHTLKVGKGNKGVHPKDYNSLIKRIQDKIQHKVSVRTKGGQEELTIVFKDQSQLNQFVAKYFFGEQPTINNANL